MTFRWLIRHQKKVLFVLAVVLMVGWGFSGVLTRLFGGRGRSRGSDVIAHIAGEDVTYMEFMNFKRTWARVFPDILSRYAIDLGYAGRGVSVDEIAWAYLGLCKLARQSYVRVPDDRVIELKKLVYQMHNGRGASLGETEQVRTWLRERLRMSGALLDQVLRERLMADAVLTDMMLALEPTDAEAWERYSDENRAVRLKYVAFSRDAFLDETDEPDEQRIEEYYEAQKGFGGRYFTPARIQIEYVKVDLRTLEANVKVSVEEMKTYYEDSKDLYPSAGGSAEDAVGEVTVSVPFPEVKPEIEALLKRRRAREKAAGVLDELRRAYDTPVPLQLETLVANRKDDALTYARTPFLTEIELLELPGIGSARADGRGIAQLAFETEWKNSPLSPVLVGPDARFVFRPVTAAREASVPDLAEVKARVIADIRKDEALRKARKAATDLRDEITKAGGVGKFEEVAAGHKLAVTETPFFINNSYDVNRPAFVWGGFPLEMGEIYGPMSSGREGVAAVVRVAAEREAPLAGFAGERELRREQLLQVKRGEFRRDVFPRTVLEFLNFEVVKRRDETAPEDVNLPKTPEPDNS